MNTTRVSATSARNNFFKLLEQVKAGKSVNIEKDNKLVAKLVPAVSSRGRYKGLTKALKAAAKGFIYSVKDNPLRRPGASDFLGRWDRE